MASRGAKLELETDDAFQRTEWRVQRVGWLVWGALVVAALAGVLGPGWLSAAHQTSAEGDLSVNYDRFLHYHHPSRIELHVKSAQGDGPWEIHIDRSLAERFAVRSIEPAPEHATATPDGIVYTFLREGDEGRITLEVEYERFGSAQGSIRLAEGGAVELRQFVYP